MNPLTWAFHDQLSLLFGVFVVRVVVAALPTIRTWPGGDQ